MKRLTISTLAFLVGACPSSGTKPATTPATPAATPADEPPVEAELPEPPYLRLPDDAYPESYAVDLTLDADKDTFTGRIKIRFVAKKQTDLLWLNAKALTVTSARLEGSAVEIIPGGDEHVGFRFKKPLVLGQHELEIEYSGKAPDENHEGVFRDQDHDRWYLYTQFEPTDARRAFPCFDDPQFKVPWQLTLHVPEDQQAYSNTGGRRSVKSGVATVEFSETKPLPSYLVAFAVGPFEEVAVGAPGQKLPMRIIVTHGRTGEAGYAAEMAPVLLGLLEEYFGTPYPYPKLDVIALPSFPGAMENAGLITFNLGLLLNPDDKWSVSMRRAAASVMAHEMGHQWFGDLVTMKWWDDIWLNEAFATWIAAKVVDRWKPEWSGGTEAIADREAGLKADSLVSARKVRQPIEVQGDIATAFDSITYRKGSAVIRMFETELGEEVFRAGVRKYMERFAWKNASSADFVAAIDEMAPGKDVTKRFSAYLDQAGAPLVKFELSCKGAKGAPPSLKLTQTRLVPVGSESAGDERWPVRVCVRYPAGGKAEQACTLLTDVEGTLPLPAAKTCPAWFSPNADGVGYYRSGITAAMAKSLLDKGAKTAPLADRVGALHDVSALVRAGHLSAGDALGLVTPAAKAKDRHLLDATIEIVAEAKGLILPDDLRPNFARFVRKVYGERARALGWQGKPGEDEDTKLLRVSLVGLVAGGGEDPDLTKAAVELAPKVLDDPGAVGNDMGEILLIVAARKGDRALFDRLHTAAGKATEQRDKIRLMAALGSFRDPVLAAEARKLSLRTDFGIFESLAILGVQISDHELREGTYEFLKANLDAIAGKLPEAFRGYVVQFGMAFCDVKHREDIDGWFRERVKTWQGADHAIVQTLEAVDQCIARRQAQEAELRKFLKAY